MDRLGRCGFDRRWLITAYRDLQTSAAHTSRGKQHCRNLDAPSRHCAHQLGYGTTVTRSSVGSLEDIEKEASRRY